MVQLAGQKPSSAVQGETTTLDQEQEQEQEELQELRLSQVRTGAGAAIKAISVACVAHTAEAREGKLPIVAINSDGELQSMLAPLWLVGIAGTAGAIAAAYYYREPLKNWINSTFGGEGRSPSEEQKDAGAELTRHTYQAVELEPDHDSKLEGVTRSSSDHRTPGVIALLLNMLPLGKAQRLRSNSNPTEVTPLSRRSSSYRALDLADNAGQDETKENAERKTPVPLVTPGILIIQRRRVAALQQKFADMQKHLPHPPFQGLTETASEGLASLYKGFLEAGRRIEALQALIHQGPIKRRNDEAIYKEETKLIRLETEILQWKRTEEHKEERTEEHEGERTEEHKEERTEEHKEERTEEHEEERTEEHKEERTEEFQEKYEEVRASLEALSKEVDNIAKNRPEAIDKAIDSAFRKLSATMQREQSMEVEQRTSLQVLETLLYSPHQIYQEIQLGRHQLYCNLLVMCLNAPRQTLQLLPEDIARNMFQADPANAERLRPFWEAELRRRESQMECDDPGIGDGR